MGMVFLEMSYSKVYVDSRFFNVPCLLLRQFEKTFTPDNRKFEEKMGKNRPKLGGIQFSVVSQRLLIATASFRVNPCLE